MNLHNSYFALPDAFAGITRWLHPYACSKSILYDKDERALQIRWTTRADKQLRMRNAPLIVEMQLYFSCVVKKRVLFHDNFHDNPELPMHKVNDMLKIAFRAVQSNSCDPHEFAASFPVKHTFSTPAALNMRPKLLELDFLHEQWQGEFFV